MYDIIIIGSGPGGYRAADYAARQGLQVLIAEKAEAGGTCLNCGCIPTKTLCHEAEVLRSPAEENLAAAMARKQQVVEQLRSGVEALMAQPGISLVRGEATLSDAHHVQVDGQIFEGKNIIIATGSRPKMPPIEGIDDPCVVSSTELLSINQLPQRLCIVGAGVIGMEFASIFAAFGSKVTVVEYLKECLPAIDSDIAKRLRKQLEKRGVEFYMQSGVKRIAQGTVFFEQKGKPKQVEADLVLVSTGRQPNTEGLNLEALGIEQYKGGIQVNSQMQTSVENIYAIGDVNGRCLLAHAATFQGLRAVNHILGQADPIRFDVMPAAVFTLPEVAAVGLTEDQCREQNVEHRVLKGFYRANGKALSMGETDGMLKLIVDQAGIEVIGCHVIGPHAADLVQEAAVAMNATNSLALLKNTIHIHPTLSEILQDTALKA